MLSIFQDLTCRSSCSRSGNQSESERPSVQSTFETGAGLREEPVRRRGREEGACEKPQLVRNTGNLV